jgi:hypothetical protein
VEQFLERLSLELQVTPDSIVIKKGFPPKPVDLGDRGKLLQDIGIKNKDTLIVEGSSAAI